MFDLPSNWWSRKYEYPWAANFAGSEDTVLDAASGICHPFKFVLADKFRSVYASDIDPRILAPDSIVKDIEHIFG